MNKMMIWVVVYIAIFGIYFLLMRGRRTQAKEMQKQMESLKPGDHIVTIGGLHALVHVVDIDSNTVILDCDGAFFRYDRRAIHHIENTPYISAFEADAMAVVEEKVMEEEVLEPTEASQNED